MAKGFNGVDGILGVGPTDLTCGTLTDPGECIPTVLDSAKTQGLLKNYELGISFKPTTKMEERNGVLTIGGVDDTLYVGELNYVPLTKTVPASLFVGIDQSMSYGKDKMLLNDKAGIVDTGTTLLLIASDAFQQYLDLTGAKTDDTTGLLKIDPKDYENVQSLWFKIGRGMYEFTRNAQTWPRELNEAMGGDKDAIYLVVNDLGTTSDSGLDFINGMVWLERFYAAYDVGEGRVGIAPATWYAGTVN
ncbi:acid protease [Obba rivulosa]|uniref:Acid protease n=1 Tax=Obba rivulosa TaxID=1052685 RepID=A0A8E2DNS2_9APHY|nr:acid protease [Obba rivulosa]